jgi:hypothetical protein
MAEQYFSNKDKEMMAPKAKKPTAMRKVFVLPRKGQKETEDVERMGRKVKRVIQIPMKAKEVIMTREKRLLSKAEKAMMKKATKKLEGLVKKRTERAEARAFKPLTLEEQNIKKQLEERLKKGMEDAKSPEQKKMEKEMLLALQAPPVEMKMMAVEAPKGKAGRPIKSTPGKEFMGMYDLTRAGDSLVKLRQEAKEKGLSSSGTKETLIDRLKEYDFKKMEEEEARPKGQKQITSFFMPKLQKQQEPLVSEEESEAESIVDATAEIVADITGAPEIKEQASATKIQKAFRGMMGRREAIKIKEEKEQQRHRLPYIRYILNNSKNFNENQLNNMSVSDLEDIIENDLKPVVGKGLVGAGVVDFVSGLASKAIDHIKKDPIGSIKQAVSIGKSAFEHGQKAKEMYDKFFKGKAKGGMLAGFTEPEKRHMVHKVYHMNLFNTMMDQNPMSSSS